MIGVPKFARNNPLAEALLVGWAPAVGFGAWTGRIPRAIERARRFPPGCPP